MSTPPIQPAQPSRSRMATTLRAVIIFLVVVVVVVGAALWYASSAQFANRVRVEVIDVLERSTGGRVELARFSWHLTRLEAEVDGLTIHGLEGPDEVPYAHLDKLLVRAKIISLFRAQNGLRLLQAEHPVFHLILYPNGTTNQPTPKTESKSSGKPVLDEVFDLAADHAQVDNGLLILNQQKIPFNASANDLSAVVNYVYANGHYNGSLSIADLTAQQGKAPGVHSKLDTPKMRGRKIMGGVVPYGEVWRTGANPATSFKTATTLKIGSATVPAGAYTLYSLPSEGTWKLIINKQTGQWGTKYNQAQDLARVDMQKKTLSSPQETMSISFENTKGNSTELHVKWETTDVYVPVMAQ